MIIRFIPIVAAAFLLAACDSEDETARRDEPPVAPSTGASNGSGEKLVTGPKGETSPLPDVAKPEPAPDKAPSAGASQSQPPAQSQSSAQAPAPSGGAPRDSSQDAAEAPKTELSQSEEKREMPVEGQTNSFMSTAPGQGQNDASAANRPGTEGSASGQGTAPAGASGGGETPSDATPGSEMARDGSQAGAEADKTQIAQAGAAAGAAGAGAAAQPAAAGMSGPELVKKHNCVSCHAVDKKLIGPAYQEVAKKYQGDDSAKEQLVQKVKKGGAGVWGPVPMPPNSSVPDDQIAAMVDWILAGAN